MISALTVERLLLYRRHLKKLSLDRVDRVFSHDIAIDVGTTPTIVRRDVMIIGYSGHTRNGYNVVELLERIEELLPELYFVNICVVGLGHIGQALVSYFSKNKSEFKVVAAFDVDPSKIDTKFEDSYCYPISVLSAVARQENIKLAIVCVPDHQAQNVVNELVENNINCILNFSHASVKVPDHVHIENIDITLMLEKTLCLGLKKKKILKEINERNVDCI